MLTQTTNPQQFMNAEAEAQAEAKHTDKNSESVSSAYTHYSRVMVVPCDASCEQGNSVSYNTIRT